MSITLAEAVAMTRAGRRAAKSCRSASSHARCHTQKVKSIIARAPWARSITSAGGGAAAASRPYVHQQGDAGVGALADFGCYARILPHSIGYHKPLTVSAYASNYFGTNRITMPMPPVSRSNDFSLRSSG
jgi:hypothetical protein